MCACLPSVIGTAPGSNAELHVFGEGPSEHCMSVDGRSVQIGSVSRRRALPYLERRDERSCRSEVQVRYGSKRHDARHVSPIRLSGLASVAMMYDQLLALRTAQISQLRIASEAKNLHLEFAKRAKIPDNGAHHDISIDIDVPACSFAD